MEFSYVTSGIREFDRVELGEVGFLKRFGASVSPRGGSANYSAKMGAIALVSNNMIHITSRRFRAIIECFAPSFLKGA